MSEQKQAAELAAALADAQRAEDDGLARARVLRAEAERLRGALRGVRQVAQDIGDVHDSYLALWIIEQVDRALGDTPDERCPTCGTTAREDRFAMLDRGRAFDAGISGCPDPFHGDTPDE